MSLGITPTSLTELMATCGAGVIRMPSPLFAFKDGLPQLEVAVASLGFTLQVMGLVTEEKDVPPSPERTISISMSPVGYVPQYTQAT